jgi:hypothetical protein
MVFIKNTSFIIALQPNINELNKKFYEFINIILTSNRTHDSLKIFRERTEKRKKKEINKRSFYLF